MINDVRARVIAEIAEKVDLPRVAERLGLTVVNLGKSNTKALCPFHDDQHPSLSFFESRDSGRKLYHCFACGAQGDAFDLVRHALHCDFNKALEWLAAETNTALPAPKTGAIRGRDLGLQTAFSIYTKEIPPEQALFRKWCEARKFEPSFLGQAEVCYSSRNKLSNSSSSLGREACDALTDAGLLYRPRRTYQKQAGGWLPVELPYSDQIFGERVVFAIRDQHGRLVGFAGRAAVEGETPKYLYSRDFPKATTLYRLDRVRGKLIAGEVPRLFHVFLVEGLMDALRLESLGLLALAVLGSRLTVGQGKLLAELAGRLERVKSRLVLHIFLDTDEAGRSGAKASLIGLMRGISQFSAEPLLDVVLPNSQCGWPDPPVDPDTFLAGIDSEDRAKQTLSEVCFSPAAFLLADALGAVHPSAVASAYAAASETERRIAFRDVETVVEREAWPTLLVRVGILHAQPLVELGLEREEPQWQQELRQYLETTAPRLPPTTLPTKLTEVVRPELRLDRAIHVARASTQRRELPVDDGSWDRLLATNDIVLPILMERLKRERAASWEPLVAVRIPKPNGETRLKALPCPEDLILQQYILSELLRSYDLCPRFSDYIPAVRHRERREGPKTWTTGVHTGGGQLISYPDTVSFAYQIEMDVVDGRVPPRREGMFRPYRECWQEFLEFIRDRVRRMNCSRLYVARLDIKRFYDRLPRFAVVDALHQPLQRALKELHDFSRMEECAGFLQATRPEQSPEDRAKRIIDWLCDHSFFYQYYDPGDGKTKRSEHELQGIPQGPDLSAYLANIALFPLDYALRQAVERLDQELSDRDLNRDKGGKLIAAVYARYVDDMVLVTSTPETQAYLRSLVERSIAQHGLELNAKADPFPPMNEDSFLDWLTARRGAGLTASGELGTTLACEPLAILGGLADAGEIERDDSLAILYNRDLDHPDVPPPEVVQAVRIARRAPDLRYGDEVSAAKHLWRCTAESGTDGQDLAKTAEEVNRLWQDTADPTRNIDAQELHRSQNPSQDAALLLVWLEGLERFLRRPAGLGPGLSLDAKDRAELLQKRVAQWVNAGLCEEIEGRFASGVKALVQHVLDARVLTIKRLALRSLPECEAMAGDLVRCRPWSSMLARLNLSLAESLLDRNRAQAMLDRDELSQSSHAGPLVMLHEAVVRLAIHEPDKTLVDPLAPMRERIERLLQQRDNAEDLTLNVLRIWLPEEPKPQTS